MPSADMFLNLTGLRRLPIIRQTETAECAIACLAMIASWHGYDLDLASLRRRFPVSLNGTTAQTLVNIAGRLGLGARAVRCELSDLCRLRTPCILHWDFKHFVVLHKVKGGRMWVNDPAAGQQRYSLAKASPHFTGIAIELSPTEHFQRKKERQPLALTKLWKWSPLMATAMLQGLLLSAFLELFVLLTPFYLQLIIDQAILKSDHNLLLGLAVAFALLVLFNAAASVLRGLIFQFLGNVMSFDMGARLFHHLVRLPLNYFQKRSQGELLQRFRSLEPVKQMIVNGGISTLIDGSLALVTCFLMLVYSVTLGSVAIGVFLLYLLLRLGFLSLAMKCSADLNVAEASEQGNFLETIRSVQTIKVSGGETRRETAWQNLYAARINCTIKVGNLAITFQALNSLLSGISDVVILYLAAQRAMRGEMTIGVITAFMAYKSQFMTRMMSLIDQLIQFKMLAVPLDRVADIALADREPGMDGAAVTDEPIRGSIELKELSFRYSTSDRLTIRKMDLRIEAGQFVAIVGPSGEGKTTLLKLLLGLYQPTEGRTLIDGKDTATRDPVTMRRQLGVVMQEDQLLAGTIADNIALFDEHINLSWVRDCAARAQIDSEIMELPMQYNSHVGDMGSALSSGQRQRVLLARALYRRPAILVLDEGTAHVDAECESRLVSMLQALPITRIVVAHSHGMAAAADRVLRMKAGTLEELRQHPGELGQPRLARAIVGGLSAM
jgi:ATP-binding cassette, subfamily B, bacterial CvaB/MchF/RaxB